MLAAGQVFAAGVDCDAQRHQQHEMRRAPGHAGEGRNAAAVVAASGDSEQEHARGEACDDDLGGVTRQIVGRQQPAYTVQPGVDRGLNDRQSQRLDVDQTPPAGDHVT